MVALVNTITTYEGHSTYPIPGQYMLCGFHTQADFYTGARGVFLGKL